MWGISVQLRDDELGGQRLGEQLAICEIAGRALCSSISISLPLSWLICPSIPS